MMGEHSIWCDVCHTYASTWIDVRIRQGAYDTLHTFDLCSLECLSKWTQNDRTRSLMRKAVVPVATVNEVAW